MILITCYQDIAIILYINTPLTILQGFKFSTVLYLYGFRNLNCTNNLLSTFVWPHFHVQAFTQHSGNTDGGTKDPALETREVPVVFSLWDQGKD
jgi:hypothetical protein